MRLVLFTSITFILFSCHCNLENINSKKRPVRYKDYFNNLKNSNLPNELKGYDFINLRNVNYRMDFPDGTVVIFDHNNCKIKIVNYLKNSSSVYQPEKEIEDKIYIVLNRLLQFNITLLATNELYFRVQIEKKFFELNSLPIYETERNRVTTNVVFVYFYKDVIQDSINDMVFNYYKPARIDQNWYYYLD